MYRIFYHAAAVIKRPESVHLRNGKIRTGRREGRPIRIFPAQNTTGALQPAAFVLNSLRKIPLRNLGDL